MRGVGHHEPDQGIHPKRCVVVQPDEWSGAHVSGEKEHGWAGAGGSEALGSEALVSRGEGSRMVHGGWSEGILVLVHLRSGRWTTKSEMSQKVLMWPRWRAQT